MLFVVNVMDVVQVPISWLDIMQQSMLPVDEKLDARHIHGKIQAILQQSYILYASIAQCPSLLHNILCQCWKHGIEWHCQKGHLHLLHHCLHGWNVIFRRIQTTSKAEIAVVRPYQANNKVESSRQQPVPQPASHQSIVLHERGLSHNFRKHPHHQGIFPIIFLPDHGQILGRTGTCHPFFSESKNPTRCKDWCVYRFSMRFI
mmetsp:Transcript_5356/g.10557  ORF Transcript_5356/g.10557 Transcript_5356/m.10557 type:complete len:203 (-) Transcript_5356:2233-2841(-)